MSNGYKNGAFALGLVTGIGLALNLFLWLDYRATQEAKDNPQTYRDSGNSEIGNVWDWLIGTFISPSDTLAQWIMAIFTIAAVVVVYFTFRTTQRMATDAAEFGHSQTRVALESVKAAKDSLEAARKSSEIQLRPWINFFGLEALPSTNTRMPDGTVLEEMFSIAFRWKNFGQSPAIKVTVIGDFHVIPRDGPVPHFPRSVGMENAVVGPTESFKGRPFHLYEGGLREFNNGLIDVICYGRVEYRSTMNPEEVLVTECTLRCRYDGIAEDKDGKKWVNVSKQVVGDQNAIT